MQCGWVADTEQSDQAYGVAVGVVDLIEKTVDAQSMSNEPQASKRLADVPDVDGADTNGSGEVTAAFGRRLQGEETTRAGLQQAVEGIRDLGSLELVRSTLAR